MTDWTVGQLLDATSGELVMEALSASRRAAAWRADRSSPVVGISTDSRRLHDREAFVAIRGPRFDGHAFLPDVVTRGASCLIVSEVPAPPPRIPTIRVSDTVRALGDLAAFHRRRFHIPVIAVTGSCGKTTTKELIAHLLGHDHRVLKTTGTQNNHIGLPLTLLRLSAAHQFAVVELGSNHPGEIAYLARLARPTMAVITNVGPAHLEFFGSLAGVMQEKLSLLESLDSVGTAIVPGDQLEVLLEARSRRPASTSMVTFGTSEHCGVQVLDVRQENGGCSVRLRDVAGRFFIPLPGLHNVENALAALTCVKVLGVPLESVRDRLASFAPLPLRSHVVRANGLTIVNDCYNANPLSFARALEILREVDVKRRVLIAGDMLELGETAPAAHRAIGHLATQVGVNVVVAIGAFADQIAAGAAISHQTTVMTCHTVEELQGLLPSLIRSGDGVLVKGSRKLRLEQVVEWLSSDTLHPASHAA